MFFCFFGDERSASHGWLRRQPKNVCFAFCWKAVGHSNFRTVFPMTDRLLGHQTKWPAVNSWQHLVQRTNPAYDVLILSWFANVVPMTCPGAQDVSHIWAKDSVTTYTKVRMFSIHTNIHANANACQNKCMIKSCGKDSTFMNLWLSKKNNILTCKYIYRNPFCNAQEQI